MTTNLWEIQKTMNGGFWDVNQVVDALSGNNDVGQITAFAPIAVPSAPTVAVNTTSGNLTGNYQYAVAFLTGYLQGDPQNPGSGTLHTQGNTGGGTASVVVSPNGQQVNLTNIPIGGTGVVARVLYRTKSGGNSYFFLQQINDNTTTSWIDNIADASLTTAMPTANTTGTKFSGDGSGLTKLPVATSSSTGVVKPAEGLILDADGTLKAPWSVKGLSSVLSPSRQSFTRSTPAGQVNGNQVASNVLRLEQGAFRKAPFLEEATTNNLSANQSNIETDTIGFSTATSTLLATGATISRDTSTYYQGSASLKVVTTATSGEGVETSGISASASSKYSASVWVNASSGQTMQLLMRDYTNSVSATPVSFTGTGQWQRISITITTGAAPVTNLTMAVVTASATAVTFNIDCLQIENKGYMTTWISGGATRNADSLSYTLDKPLASRWSASIVWKPELPSSASAPNNARMLLAIGGTGTNKDRYQLQWISGVNPYIQFKKSVDGTNWTTIGSNSFTFNAGDSIYIECDDDPTAGYINVRTSVNNGTVSVATPIASTSQITDAQQVYTGCYTTAGYEANGTIECILHELATGETITTDEVTALFGASDWGLGDYPVSNVQSRGDGGIELPPLGAGSNQWSAAVFFNYVDGNGVKQRRSLESDQLGNLRWSTPNVADLNLAQVLSGGYKIQSGSGLISVATANVEVTGGVAFPIAYPSGATPIVIVSITDINSTSGYSYVRAGAVTNTGFTLAANSYTPQTIHFDWLVIG